MTVYAIVDLQPTSVNGQDLSNGVLLFIGFCLVAVKLATAYYLVLFGVGGLGLLTMDDVTLKTILQENVEALRMITLARKIVYGAPKGLEGVYNMGVVCSIAAVLLFVQSVDYAVRNLSCCKKQTRLVRYELCTWKDLVRVFPHAKSRCCCSSNLYLRMSSDEFTLLYHLIHSQQCVDWSLLANVIPKLNLGVCPIYIAHVANA